jgi:uncharacterized phage protein gp47/JayE
MVKLSLQNFTSLVQNSSAAVQGACSSLLDLTVGSVLRAILEANASIALWLQWLIVLLMQRQRLATSSDSDVDTWVADYGFSRLPSVAATGAVTFARFTATSSATLPVGATARTANGAQTYSVTADPLNAYWDGVSNYVIPAGTTSITVPVLALTSGAVGNVVAGAINLLGSAVSGIDTCTNALALTNGQDAESDLDVKARFPQYIIGLREATPAAIGAAILGVQQSLAYGIAENMDEVGNYEPGHFVVTLDDGTGSPSTTLKALVYTAVDAVRPIGSTFSVQSPTVVTVNVSLVLTAAAGFVKANMIAPLATAITAYIEALPVGGGLSYTRLAQVIYDAIPGVSAITGYTLNGSAVDIAAGPSTVLKPGTVSIS